MKKYISFFRIRFITGLSYRAAAWSGMVTQFFWGMMLILSFNAFYRTDPAAFSMDFSALCSYIWLQEALHSLFTIWRMDNSTFESIRSGDIAYELARPIGLYGTWFSKDLASSISNTLMRCIPVILVTAFLPAPYGLKLPANLFSGIMFLISLSLGVLVISAVRMLIYISTFHTLNPRGVQVVAVSAAEFLSGAIIPLPFFPDKPRTVVECTPFAALQSSPLLIYTGAYTPEKALYLLGLQLFWAVTLIVLGRVWLSHSLRRVVVQGG